MLAAQNAAYIKEEVLPVHTSVHQVVDGTIFYFKGSEPHRLHIKWLGKDVNAKLPEGRIVYVFAFDNAIYFTLNSGQVYKATAELDKITVSFVRPLYSFEIVDPLGLCKRMEFGYYDYVYRVCDQEIPDGIPIDIKMDKFQPARIHRGKLYYVRFNDDEQMEMNLMGEKIVGFDIPNITTGRSWGSYAREDSPYIHFSYQHHLFTFNVETREAFPILVFGNMFNLQIKSFEKGRPLTVHDIPLATLKAADQGLPGLYKAADHNKQISSTLPFKFDAPKVPTGTPVFGYSPKVEEPKKMSALDHRIEEMEKEFQSKEQSQKVQEDHAKYLDKKLNEIQFQAPVEETEEAKKRRQYEEELIDQNFELTQQLEQLKRANEEKDETAAEELAKLCERNEELTKINKGLEAENWEITQELDRIETENEELEAANMELIQETEELTKRKENREKEMQATIAELEAKNSEIAEDIERMKLTNTDLVKALEGTVDTSSGEEYEIIDNEEVLPVHTTVHQLDDGTLFYFKGSEPHRLYIKWVSQDVEAELPKGKIVHLFALHNAIYFTMQSNHVFKATADLNKITVSFVRTLQTFESVDALGLCTRMEFGYHDYVYRLCDNEIPDGVPIDAEMTNFQRARIHRGKLYYVRESLYKLSEMTLMGSNIVGFDIPSFGLCRSWASYAREDSPFIHFSFQHHLHTINVETREVFPMMVFGDMFNLQIISVIDNIATLTGQADGQTHLITAEFPPGYFNKGFPITLNEIPTAVADEKNFLAPKYKAEDHNVKKIDWFDFTFKADTSFNSNSGRGFNFNVDKVTEPAKPMSLLDQRVYEMNQEFKAKEQSQRVQEDHAKFLDKKLNEIQFQASEEETEEAKKRREYEEEKDESAAEELAKLCEHNEELTKINKALEAENWEITQELDRIETENEELEAANMELIQETEELTKRKEKREKEMQAIIEELETKSAEIAEDVERMKLTNTDISSTDEEIAELEKQIEIIMKMNEKLAKALEDTADASNGEEYEIIDNVSE
ncbi:hypothetical protein PRIPAC_90360 [Pristionchus pacificus]|uniref:E3 ubiquitin protein ligase n=1 Tax=Pristionchus pacificus TaxID=54126 RepID=A0A2A6CW54_PRIPA|nr:hypothetical protein PRIPAC_90360 [Pristionchus pacificus]|eukprot:PDM82464.1 hypothetical protein PRIPAC_36857 [Pristionchus pacificus]